MTLTDSAEPLYPTTSTTTPPTSTLRLGPLTIDPVACEVTAGDAVLSLRPLEYKLLVTLAATPGRVFSREDLLAEVWDWADASGTRTVDSHIKALRRKIGAERIRTVHGVGYALETPAA